MASKCDWCHCCLRSDRQGFVRVGRSGWPWWTQVGRSRGDDQELRRWLQQGLVSSSWTGAGTEGSVEPDRVLADGCRLLRVEQHRGCSEDRGLGREAWRLDKSSGAHAEQTLYLWWQGKSLLVVTLTTTLTLSSSRLRFPLRNRDWSIPLIRRIMMRPWLERAGSWWCLWARWKWLWTR